MNFIKTYFYKVTKTIFCDSPTPNGCNSCCITFIIWSNLFNKEIYVLNFEGFCQKRFKAQRTCDIVENH